MGNVSVSLPSDGTTADVADYNTPITTIVDEFNGNIDNSNIASAAAISGSKLADNSVLSGKLGLSSSYTGGVQSQANAGTAGGTIYYINMGGLKMAWGFTSTLSVSGAAPQSSAYTITLPTSFFSSVQYVNVTPVGGAATNTQYTLAAPNAAVSTSTVSFYFAELSGSNGSTSKGHFLVIGT